jgi:lysophospholipase L1-like esterase
LFGDSISAELGNNLGANNFNFGFDGLSSVSLVEQLQSLIPNKVKCQKAVIAVGGNDAWYGMSDESFRQKLQSAISLIRKMGTKDIYLVPAFYSTVAASNDPTISAPIAKVTQINNIINQVGAEEKIPVLVEDLAGLYENNALKETLSSDGDHLNRAGLQIYQAALVKILGK